MSTETARLKYKIQQCRNRLSEVLYPSPELFTDLEGVHVLTSDERDFCIQIHTKENASSDECNEALFNYLSEKSEEQCCQFLDILRYSGQSHVANYIKYSGGNLDVVYFCFDDDCVISL